jgi:hypothetical protein
METRDNAFATMYSSKSDIDNASFHFLRSLSLNIEYVQEFLNVCSVTFLFLNHCEITRLRKNRYGNRKRTWTKRISIIRRKTRLLYILRAIHLDFLIIENFICARQAYIIV